MIKISLTAAEVAVISLKAKFNIPAHLPTVVKVESWRHSKSIASEITCHVSIFTDGSTVVQGAGATFNDALRMIANRLEEKNAPGSITTEEAVECTSSSTTQNTPPTQS